MTKIYGYIDGSPYQIGENVKIIKGTDETFLPEFIDKTGKVVHLEYSCGCGQIFPIDPMIGVLFDDGQVEEFWQEELNLIN